MFSEINVMLSTLVNFLVTLVIHLIFFQTIRRLEIKMPDCADSQSYVCLKKNGY